MAGAKNRQKDDPLLYTVAVSSTLKVATPRWLSRLRMGVIHQRAVSDVIAKAWLRNRTDGDIVCCFFAPAVLIAPLVKDSREHSAPATVRKNKQTSDKTRSKAHKEIVSASKSANQKNVQLSSDKITLGSVRQQTH